MRNLLKAFINNLDTLLAVILSIVAAVFGTFGLFENALLPAIAASIGLVATGIMRDRYTRANLISEIRKLADISTKLDSKSSADAFFTFNTSEAQLIADAREEVWLIQETGSLGCVDVW